MGFFKVIGWGIGAVFAGAVALKACDGNENSYLKNLGNELRQGGADFAEGVGNISGDDVENTTRAAKEKIGEFLSGVQRGLTNEKSNVEKYGYRPPGQAPAPQRRNGSRSNCNPATSTTLCPSKGNPNARIMLRTEGTGEWQYVDPVTGECYDMTTGALEACVPVVR